MHKPKFKFFKRPHAFFEQITEAYPVLEDVETNTASKDNYVSFYLFGIRVSRKETHVKPIITDVLYIAEKVRKIAKTQGNVGFKRTNNQIK